MRNTKRLMSILMTLAIALSLLPAAARPAHAAASKTLVVTITAGTESAAAMTTAITDALASETFDAEDVATLKFESASSYYIGTDGSYSGNVLDTLLPNMTVIDLYDFQGSFANNAFAYAKNITTVRLPSYSTSYILSRYIFAGCDNLTTVYRTTETPGVVDLSELIGTGTIGTFSHTDANSGEGHQFSGCTSITAVKLPSGTSPLSYSIFSGCTSLTTIGDIPGEVDLTGRTFRTYSTNPVTSDRQFAGCTSITTVKLSPTTRLSGLIFENCTSLDTVYTGVKTAGVVDLSGLTAPSPFPDQCSGFFYGCTAITTVKLPIGVFIPGWMFAECISLTTIGDVAGIVDLSDITFTSTSLYRSNFYQFYNCTSITTIKLPIGDTLPQGVFYGCSSLTTAGDAPGVLDLTDCGGFAGDGSQFEDCVAVTTIKLPVNVSIAARMFAGCASLETAYTGTMVAGVMDFSGLTASAPFNESIDYSTPREQFIDCTAITAIKLPNGVTLSDSIFKGCIGITTVGDVTGVVDLSGVTFSSGSQFEDCVSIDTVKLSSSTTLSDCMFKGCTVLKTVGDVTNIVDLTGHSFAGNSQFENCSSIITIRLPGSPAMPGSIFSGCSALKVILLPNSSTLSNPTSSAFTGVSSLMLLVNDAWKSSFTTLLSRLPTGSAFPAISGAGTLPVGDSLSLSVTQALTAVPLTYQWQLDGNAIPGETGKTYDIAAVTLADAGDYTCAVTYADASVTYTTVAATVTVNKGTQAAPTGLGKTDASTIGGSDGEISGVTTAMEYKLSSELTYTPVAGTVITGLEAGIYLVRFAETAFYEAGVDAVITISDPSAIPKEPTTAADIDFTNGRITGLAADAEYTVNGSVISVDASGQIDVDPAWLGTAISIVKTGVAADGTQDSDPQNLLIPARPFAPSPGKSDTTGGGSNGAITYVDDTMEYRLDTAGAWTDISGTSVTGLAAGTYEVRVKATAASFSGEATSITIAGSSGGRSNDDGDGYNNGEGTSTSGAAPSSSSLSDSGPPVAGSTVFVDGKETSAGAVTFSYEKTIVTIHQDLIRSEIENAREQVAVIIPGDEGTGSSEAVLVVKNVDDMAEKDMTLSVQAGDVRYDIPTAAIDTAAIMAALGADDPAQVPLSVTITTGLGAAALEAVKATIDTNGSELVFPPVAFSITATYNGQVTEVTTFAQYVSRTMEITAEQAAKVTTAVVVEPDGSVRHVPTYVYQEGGKWYVTVNCLTNSVYALIYNDIVFSDAAGKWYEAAVNEMGSREVVSGVGDGRFEGERAISRAEFTAILIRAMGLPAGRSAQVFNDVPASAWYSGAVNEAYEYGLTVGVGGGKFAPEREITRQEAMAMVYSAAKLMGYTGDDATTAAAVADAATAQAAAGGQSGSGSSLNLDAFPDAGAVSAWAIGAAEFNVGSGLIAGSDGMLLPAEPISRAETAALLLRLLQKAGLIDVR